MIEQKPNKFCIRGTLVQKRDGDYVTMVFQDLDYVKTPGFIPYQYVMCTLLPNWQIEAPEIGQTGYLHYRIVNAGETWYNKETGEYVAYQYSANYFEDFVPVTHVIENNIVSKLDDIRIS